ncbi:MAG: alpha-glucosidase C-terminal domain-containing protein [Halanaerobiales bacterium]|nr:alpha-glucosidase C-terminal domain-containing protein [Halanaerobiales bacterium]
MFKRVGVLLCLVMLFWGTMAFGASNDNNVEWDGVFHDQGPMYFSPQEPTANDNAYIRLRVFKSDITGGTIKYYDSGDGQFHYVNMYWVKNDPTGVFDIWEGVISGSSSTKWYRLQISDGWKNAWLNAKGISSNEPSQGDFWIVPQFSTPDWVKDAIFYQIFPDRFCNGNTSNDVVDGEYVYLGDSVIAKGWDESMDGVGHEFYNGDLIGVYQKLPTYLQEELGINAIYLNPIFQSPNNHKYDCQDFYLVDPHFGSNNDLAYLVDKAHSTNDFAGDYRVSIVLDGVFNHTGTWHYWFDKDNDYASLGAYESQSSTWRSFYTFSNWPNDYVSWWGLPTMPKLDFSSTQLGDEIYRNSDSVIQHYLKAPYNIDGWRFDVANEIGKNGTEEGNHEIWQEIRTYIKSVNPDAYMLGEFWENSVSWLGGDQWDAAMNYYGFIIPVSNWVAGKDTHNNTQVIDTNTFDIQLTQRLAEIPRQAQLTMLNSLSTHDTARFLYRADEDIWKLKVAAVFQMTFIGTPCIYYGDEIGMTGGNDPYNRASFRWDPADWNNDILTLYKNLIQIRKTYPALKTGSFKPLLVDNNNKIYSFGRWDEDNRIIVALNNDSTSHNVTVNAWQLSIPNGATVTDALTGNQYTVVNGQITITGLFGHTGAILVHE